MKRWLCMLLTLVLLVAGIPVQAENLTLSSEEIVSDLEVSDTETIETETAAVEGSEVEIPAEVLYDAEADEADVSVSDVLILGDMEIADEAADEITDETPDAAGDECTETVTEEMLPEMLTDEFVIEEVVSVNTAEVCAEQAENFVFTQEFPEIGMQVTLSADPGKVPENLRAQISLVPASAMKKAEAKLEEAADYLMEKHRSEAGADPQSVFAKYSQLEMDVNDIYGFDFELTYMDAEGNECSFEPEETGDIHITIESPLLAEAVYDEMQEVEFLHVPAGLLQKGKNTGNASAELEILTDQTVFRDGSLHFDAEHFSVYAVSVMKYRAVVNPAVLTAMQKAWGIIAASADPAYFLTDPYRNTMTDAQYREIKATAERVTAGCRTSYEKMQAITNYVSDTVYYDYVYYNGTYLYGQKNLPVFTDPYDVHIYKRTVCAGYTRYTCSLLISIGIPAMYVPAEMHAYNFMYDAESRRWIFADTTWNSMNHYTEDRQWLYRGSHTIYFDMPLESAAALSNHEVYEMPGITDGSGVYYAVQTNQANWCNTQEWRMAVHDVKQGITSASAGSVVNGMPVSAIHDSNFRSNKTLKHLDLSRTRISEIPDYTFWKNAYLKSIKLPAALTRIGYAAFYECNGLTEINLSGTQVKTLDEFAFGGCESAKKIFLPPTLTSIGQYAFSSGKWLDTSVVTDLSAKQIKYSGDNKSKIWTNRRVSVYEVDPAAVKGYLIRFNGNGATGGSMKDMKCADMKKTYKLSGNKYKRTGYTFAGWTTKKNGKGTVYKNKAKIKQLTKKKHTVVTLYAKWQKKEYAIVYKLNGGKNHSKNPKSYTITTKTIKLKTPKRKGYKFAGWYTDKKLKKRIKKVPKGSTGKLVLYAKWKK